MQKIHAKRAFTGDAWLSDVRIDIADDGRIARVGSQDSAREGAADHRCDMVLPAPVNLHSHAFQRAMAGRTEARGPDMKDSFWTWRRLMYRFLELLTPDDVQAIAALVYMEMLEAGYAAVAEFHYLHHDPGGRTYADPAEMSARVVAAAGQAGIGLTLLPVLYQAGGCDGRALTGGQRRFGCDTEGFARLHEGAAQAVAGAGRGDDAIGVAPHSLRAVGPGALREAVALAPDGPVHLHLAEQVAEVDEVLAHLGARPVEWLLANAGVDPRWCLIHCTQMNAAETVALARSGAVAGLCPITEANLGDGIFPATGFLEAGGGFGVGSDSNVEITLFGELRQLEYSQRLRDRSRAALATLYHSTGRVLLDQALRGGAQAAGRASGGLAPGQWADLIGLQTGNHILTGQSGDTALDTLIFGGHGRECITDVWSAGRHVVRGGRHVARDRITRDFCRVTARLDGAA